MVYISYKDRREELQLHVDMVHMLTRLVGFREEKALQTCKEGRKNMAVRTDHHKVKVFRKRGLTYIQWPNQICL